MKNLTQLVQQGLELTAANDGATILKNGQEATKGYAVGGLMEFKLPYASADQRTIQELTFDALACINTIECDAYGFWLDGETLYIDAVTIFQDAPTALAFAAENDELAIFCIHTQDEIRL